MRAELFPQSSTAATEMQQQQQQSQPHGPGVPQSWAPIPAHSIQQGADLSQNQERSGPQSQPPPYGFPMAPASHLGSASQYALGYGVGGIGMMPMGFQIKPMRETKRRKGERAWPTN